MLALESLNCQLEYCAPVGALLTLQVTVPPRVTDEGEQETLATLAVPWEWRCMMGQEYLDTYHSSSANVVEVVEPTPRPVCVPTVSTVAMLVLAVLQFPSKSPLISVYWSEP